MSGAVRRRLVGLALFAFIPATLVLMLRMPLGPGPSLLLAAAVIAGHRRVASRWVYRAAPSRCLWCGGAPRDAVEVVLRGVVPLSCCAAHRGSLLRFLAFCHRARHALRVGILVPVLGYFALGFAAWLGAPVPGLPWRRTLFRGIVGVTVLSVALGHRLARPVAPEAFPFPIHNLALLGVRFTLVIFGLVGTAWVVLTVWELA